MQDHEGVIPMQLEGEHQTGEGLSPISNGLG